jgi:hypothetical protein
MIIRVQFNATDRSFKTAFSATDQGFTPTFAALQRSPPESDSEYNGEYEVTPLVDKETTLLTAKKIMSRNVVVKQIPYYETSNESDGATVYIGEVEVNYGNQ